MCSKCDQSQSIQDQVKPWSHIHLTIRHPPNQGLLKSQPSINAIPRFAIVHGRDWIISKIWVVLFLFMTDQIWSVDAREYMCTCIYIYMNIYIHMYVCMNVCICSYVYIYIYVYILYMYSLCFFCSLCICIYVSIHLCTWNENNKHTNIHICTYIHIHVYMCIYTNMYTFM